MPPAATFNSLSFTMAALYISSHWLRAAAEEFEYSLFLFATTSLLQDGLKSSLKDVLLHVKHVVKQTRGIRQHPGQEGGLSSSIPRKNLHEHVVRAPVLTPQPRENRQEEKLE
ncbi:hypothetical protein NQZ68_006001 [Dissostichus eleginoides]|nr:hypothetical protein NQZ68_006001 [Dissostichus eleginoides]